MQSKIIAHLDDMRDSIPSGISQIAEIVKRTLGPGGLPILIERVGQSPDGTPIGPLMTKDGVTVANECFSSDPLDDLIIQAVKSICTRTNKVVGDGTTTAIVLGEAILQNALAEINDLGPALNPQYVRDSIEAASKTVIALLQQEVVEVKDLKQIGEVATISANGDSDIGAIIKEAFEAVGAEGVITVDEGTSAKTTIDVVDGFQIDRGAEAQNRFFNNKENTKFEAENVHVILFDGNLYNFSDLIPAFKLIQENNGKGFPPVLLVANEFSQEVIQFLLIQRAQAGISTCAVKSPHMTTVRTDMLDDMAVLLGGTRMGNGNKNLQSITYDDIGIASKLAVGRHVTTFYGGMGADEEVLNRVDQLKAAKIEAPSQYDASLIADRIAALSQGIAKIGVGGTTEMEAKERYHRIEDALNSARAAIEQGVIPGGGVALYKIGNLILNKQNKTVGEKIVGNALLTPLRQIVENVGEDVDAILNEEFDYTLLTKNKTIVYDAKEKTVVDALDAGIIDPFKVTRIALENAVSIAALLSTCGGGIVFDRRQQP